jgi:hypothetical protein
VGTKASGIDRSRGADLRKIKVPRRSKKQRTTRSGAARICFTRKKKRSKAKLPRFDRTRLFLFFGFAATTKFPFQDTCKFPGGF